MAIDHDAGEISLLDAIDHVVAWRWLFISVIVAAMVAVPLLYATTVPIYKVEVAVSVYPAIPGTTSSAIDAEIGERLSRDFPGIASTRHGYSLSVGGHDAAIETAASLGSAVDSYEALLRSRISEAHNRLAADFMKAPNNSAVYESLARYNVFFDGNKAISLIPHRESITARWPAMWVALIYSALAGLVAASILSLLAELLISWRGHRK